MTSPWFIDELHITIRLLAAMLLGGLVGMERERSHHAAGLRTHILVCLGSTLIMLLSIYGFSAFVDEPNARVDPSRIASSVITGIGFLGAGTILFTGKSITGLTTAASLWVVAAIGLAIGAGFYFAGIASTLLVLLNLWVFNKIEKRFFGGKQMHVIKVTAADREGLLGAMTDVLKRHNAELRKISVEDHNNEEEAGSKNVSLTLTVLLRKKNLVIPLVEGLKAIPGVSAVMVD